MLNANIYSGTLQMEFDWTAKKSKLRGRSCMKLKHHNNVACVCCVYLFCFILCVLLCFVFCFVDLLVCLLDDLFGSLGFCIGYLGCFAARLVPWFRWSRVCRRVGRPLTGKWSRMGLLRQGFRKVRGLQWIFLAASKELTYSPKVSGTSNGGTNAWG